ncbi:response regulator [Megalodesulfovibrio paquesii]
MTDQGLHILIADDSRPLRTVALHMLRKLGRCQEACDGREAVSLFEAALRRKEPFDLVVLDILMPRLNGVDALREIRRMEQHHGLDEDGRSKVVMLTSLDDPRFMLEAQLDAQADYYLTKPFDSDQMREALAGLGLLHESGTTAPVCDDEPAD